MRTAALSLAIGLLVAGTAWAGEAPPSPANCEKGETCGSPNCCSHCGRHGCCDKYCQVVPTTKEIKKTVWEVKCEEFCTSLPGCQKCCDKCCKACDGKGCPTCYKSCDVCAVEKAKDYVPPKCGKVRCKKTVEKKEVVCKVPAYKCVVVYCCPNCGAAGATSPSPAPAGPKQKPGPAPIPAPPKTAAIAPLPPLGFSMTTP